MEKFYSRKKITSLVTAIAFVLLSVIAAIALAFTLLGCSNIGSKPSGAPVWLDKLEPEEVDDIEVTSPAVKLPQKPDAAPTADKTNPTAFGTVSVSDECYTLDTDTQDGLFTVSYDSDDFLPAYAYLYVPVTNYDGNGYFKIKANCESVERLSVLAVYYEQFEQNRPAVTVYNGSVMDGENTIICELGNAAVPDAAYNVAVGEKLTQKTVCGFMLMIDSNPKQVIDEYSGKMTVTDMAVCDENDPDLSGLYAAPYVSGWKQGFGFSSCKITTTRPADANRVDAEIAYTVSGKENFARIEAEISNYKPEYTTLKMELKGANVKTLSIAIKYTLKSSPDSQDYNYVSSFGMQVKPDWDSYEYDFSTTEELKDWEGNTVPGSYIKNLRPTAIYFFVDGGLDNTGTLYVRNVSFEKPEGEDGAPRITSTWTTAGAGMTKSKIASGGIGTLVYEKRQGWNPVTINVNSYDSQYTTLIVRVKFYNEYSNLGIALGYGSSNTVVLQSAGMVTPNGFGLKLVSHTTEEGEDEDGKYTFHTIEIDFSQATTTSGGSERLAEQGITKIMLFIDAVGKNGSGAWVDAAAGGTYSSPRRMQFVGIELKVPTEEEAE